MKHKVKLIGVICMISRCLFFIYRTWVVRVGGMVGGSVDRSKVNKRLLLRSLQLYQQTQPIRSRDKYLGYLTYNNVFLLETPHSAQKSRMCSHSTSPVLYYRSSFCARSPTNPFKFLHQCQFLRRSQPRAVYTTSCYKHFLLRKIILQVKQNRL